MLLLDMFTGSPVDPYISTGALNFLSNEEHFHRDSNLQFGTNE
jgi:hypothetical protein